MPDLGAYTSYVLLAYGGSLGLIAVLLGLTLRRSARIKAQLAEVEARADRAS